MKLPDNSLIDARIAALEFMIVQIYAHALSKARNPETAVAKLRSDLEKVAPDRDNSNVLADDLIPHVRRDLARSMDRIERGVAELLQRDQRAQDS